MAPSGHNSTEIVQTESVEVRVVSGSNGNDSGHQEIPLPRDRALILLTGIFLLLLLFALYFARDVVVPIAFALVLSLMLQPVMRWMTAI